MSFPTSLLVVIPVVIATVMAALGSATAAVADTRRVIERPELHQDWIPALKAHPLTSASFVVRLHQNNLEELARFALNVSTPGNPMYGHFMSAAEVNEWTMPDAEETLGVARYFEQSIANATVKVDLPQGIICVTATVKQVERVLQTKFEYLVNRASNQKALVARSYVIPREVEASVAAVFGLHGLPVSRSRRPPYRRPVGPGVDPIMTPGAIAKLYNITGKASGNANVRQAVFESMENMSDIDLATFFSKYLPNSTSDDAKIYKYVGNAANRIGEDAELNIQYIMGVAPGLKTEFWVFPTGDYCRDLQNWTTTILAQEGGPLVHSVSYGWQNNLTKLGCSNRELDVIDGDFSKIAARGISIIASSGENGSGYQPAPPAPEPPYP